MATISSKDIRQAVREHYGEVAQKGSSCCAPSCCSPETRKEPSADDTAKALGYTAEEITAVPEGSNLGLGCGNPQAIASLKAGETVLDLGSGAGFLRTCDACLLRGNTRLTFTAKWPEA